jgi:hypothetical protein
MADPAGNNTEMPDAIRAAERYVPVDDLFVISTYYNPQNYRTRKDNTSRFIRKLQESRMHWMIIECAFPGQKFHLPASKNVLHVMGEDVMWQKERLLNLGVKELPGHCTKIAWVDSDILFDDPLWAVRTSELLDDYAVVQPFENVVMLPEGHSGYSGLGDIHQSFGCHYSKFPHTLLQGLFHLHGHPGFAWAARRRVFEKHGFCDFFIMGGADDVMAHAFCGDWGSLCMKRQTGGNAALEKRAVGWCSKIYPEVRARVSYAPGNALHLWHGHLRDRGYDSRSPDLSSLGFDPEQDLELSETGLWKFPGNRDDLRAWSRNYFRDRKEDG